jgi:predicted CXXCH cytochrome family protein
MRRTIRLRELCVCLAAIAAVAAAKPHPVPLDKNTDAAKCIECHEDKTKGKSVHSAMQMGCFACHELRVSKEMTRIKLTTATPVKLCIQCHADKDVATAKGSVHSPNVRDCLKCHDPHQSANKNQLLKPIAGPTSKDNLCLDCHKTGTTVDTKTGSRHAVLDGCDTCHTIHKTGPATDHEAKFHLAKKTPEMCIECHDPKDEALAKAHQNQPFAKTDCLSCHDPHESKSPKLMQTFVHDVFSSCDTCHNAPKDGKVVLTQAKSNDLCVTCHSEQAETIAKAKVSHAGAQGDCIDCHSPHAGKSRELLKPDPVNVCLPCHDPVATDLKKAHPHEPAVVEGCQTCHLAHGGDDPKLLRASDPNKLCLECHGPDAERPVNEKEKTFTLFNGKVTLPQSYLSKLTILPIKYGLGHPTEQHPISNLMDVKDPTKVKTQMNCLTCHQAHSSAKPGLLVKDQANNYEFCKSCHVNGLNLKSTMMGGK